VGPVARSRLLPAGVRLQGARLRPHDHRSREAWDIGNYATRNTIFATTARSSRRSTQSRRRRSTTRPAATSTSRCRGCSRTTRRRFPLHPPRLVAAKKGVTGLWKTCRSRRPISRRWAGRRPVIARREALRPQEGRGLRRDPLFSFRARLRRRPRSPRRSRHADPRRRVEPETLARLRHAMGLDRPSLSSTSIGWRARRAATSAPRSSTTCPSGA